MDLAKMVLIQDDELAQRLIVTWPLVAHVPENQNQAELWEKVSGVDRIDVTRKLPMLHANGFLGPDGLVDDDVLKFIRTVLATKLTGSRPQRKKASS